jgi:hypothetical protein
MDNYLSKFVPTSNSFQRLEEMFDDMKENKKVKRTVKLAPIFVARVITIQLLS